MVEDRETWLIEPNGDRQEKMADAHIARECKKIQEQWSERQRARRSKWATSAPLTVDDEIPIPPDLAALLDIPAI
jgi:hypothetical protein